MTTRKLYSLLTIGSLVVLSILLYVQCLTCTLNLVSIGVDLIIGLLSALLLLFLIDERDKRHDRKQFGYLEGKYKRQCRYNETDEYKKLNCGLFSEELKKKGVSTRWKEVESAKNDFPEIELFYKGNGEYVIPSINYDEKWYAKATIILDSSNRTMGKGVYHYTHKSKTIPQDFGTCELFVDATDITKIYLFHQNYLPSGLSVGYEIFERQ